jgi:hypothetical protein
MPFEWQEISSLSIVRCVNLLFILLLFQRLVFDAIAVFIAIAQEQIILFVRNSFLAQWEGSLP